MVKEAEVLPVATVTDEGTNAPKLTMATGNGETAALSRPTMHVLVPSTPITTLGVQVRERSIGGVEGAGAAANTVRSVPAEVPFRVAVIRAVVFVGTDAAVALNVPLLDPAATVTVVGTASAAWLLESVTAVELVTVLFRPTVQFTCPGPVTLPTAQLN
jgi:hypothetical protein